MSSKPQTVVCHSLDEVRTHIDRIDRQLVGLMAERETYVRQAARFKKTIEDVVVPARIEQIVVKVRALAAELGGSLKAAGTTAMAELYAFIKAYVVAESTHTLVAETEKHLNVGGTAVASRRIAWLV